MRSKPDCIPCSVRQALTTAKLASADEGLQREMVDRAMGVLLGYPLERPPAEMATVAIRAALELLDARDPFREAKARHNLVALELVERYRKVVKEAADPLLTALKLAVAGNVIDFGVGKGFNLERTVEKALNSDFAINELEQFKEDLKGAATILFIADNAGEIAFDKFLLEQLADKEAYVAVKAGPILNDATPEDAKQVGIDRLAKLVTTGSDSLGVNLDHCSEEFKSLFWSADLVVGKGHANFETMDEAAREVYLLLMVKCPVVAAELGVQVGAMVLVRM